VKIVGGLLLVFFLFCYAAFYFIVRSERFRTWVQSELSARSGYEVRLDDFRLTPWLSVAVSGVVISKNGEILFQGKRIVGFFSPPDLYTGRIRRLSFEKPVLHLSLQDLFSPSGKTSNLSIGTLNIDDGEFVLETGYGEPFALRSIFLSAKDVNLGGTTGLQLRTYLPAMNGTAALSISGGAEERRAEIVVGQAEGKLLPQFLPNVSKEKTVLKASFQVKPKENGAYEVKGSGQVDAFRWGAESINGQFDSLFELDTKLQNALLSVDLKMPRFPAKLLPAEIPFDPGPVTAAVSGDYSVAKKAMTVKKINMTTSVGALDGEGTIALGEKPAALKTTIRLRDVALNSLKPFMPESWRALAYSGKIAADLNLSGAYNDPVIAGIAWNDGAKVEGEKFSVAQLSSKVPFQWTRFSLQVKAGRFQMKDLLLGRKGETQFKVQEASLLGDIAKEHQKPPQVAADFQIIEGRFSAPDESKVGEHLNVKGRLSCQDCNGDLSFKGDARIESLELLWGKFFGDFKDQRPYIQVDGSYQREADDIRFDQLHLSLSSVGELDLKGSVQHLLAEPEFKLEARSDDLRLAGFYDFFIRETLKGSHPLLENIGIGGKSNLALRTQGAVGSFTVEGNLRLEQGEVREKSGRWRIGPVALDLPLRLRFPHAAQENLAEPSRAGKLSIEEIKTPSSTIPKISVPVALWNDSLQFPEPIRVSLFGGVGVIEDLAWKDVVGTPADFSFSLRLNALRLLDLTQALGWYRFGGTLSGSIPRVHWAGDSLRSDGAITLNVFGGQVTIRGMEVDEPLSPVRSVKMDVRLDDLDLEQASETFEFGRISGVLAGSIDGLVVTQGQPAEFRADIRSVDKAGVSQWISVEALNKITVLSSGNEAGFIYGGIAEFFDFFRYSKLGFKASLKNDKLILRGIETRNEQEYLVVGTLLPPTVNIVSYTQEIDFSELLHRLERVQKSGNPKGLKHP
jgi:hypothetical protein